VHLQAHFLVDQASLPPPNPDRLPRRAVHLQAHFLVDKASSPAWTGGVGYLTDAVVKAHLPAPGPDHLIMVGGAAVPLRTPVPLPSRCAPLCPCRPAAHPCAPAVRLARVLGAVVRGDTRAPSSGERAPHGEAVCGADPRGAASCCAGVRAASHDERSQRGQASGQVSGARLDAALQLAPWRPGIAGGAACGQI
jgi:hypothetical protein